MVMNTWNLSKNISNLDTEQDTVMGSFEKDFKDLYVIEKLILQGFYFFFLFLQGFHFCISPSNLLGEVFSQFIFV